MSRISVLTSLLAVGAASLIAAPAANAYTEEPLGWCAATLETPKLESISIPSTTSVAPDGTGRGTISVTVRSGGPGHVEGVQFRVFGPDFKPVGVFWYEGNGCARVRLPLAEISGAGTPKMKLRKGSAYFVSVRPYAADSDGPIAGGISFLIEELRAIRGGFLAQ